LPLSTPVALRIPGLDEPLKLTLHDDRDQFISRRIRDEGIWEPFETSLVMASLSSGSVFVDVGANIGYFTVLAACRVAASGKVFAFEPEPENFSLLRANLAMNGLLRRAEALHAALSDEEGEGRLYLSEDNLGDHQIYRSGEHRRSVEVSLLNGSKYLQERVVRLDLLKVDTQGSETLVMSGLMPLLRRLPSVPRILIELTPLSLREAGSSGRELIELLATLGQPFWIVDHLDHRLVASSAGELAQWCDGVDAVTDDRGFMNIFVGSAPATPTVQRK
jgi:FkbM family methyltransferase